MNVERKQHALPQSQGEEGHFLNVKKCLGHYADCKLLQTQHPGLSYIWLARKRESKIFSIATIWDLLLRVVGQFFSKNGSSFLFSNQFFGTI